MLMDMFYGATEGIVKHRQRFHFHEVSFCFGVKLMTWQLFAITSVYLNYTYKYIESKEENFELLFMIPFPMETWVPLKLLLYVLLLCTCFHFMKYMFLQAMLKINEHMHRLWKNQVEEKSLRSSISGWITNLPFDSKVKEWVAAEEKYKQEVQMKNILPAVADKFLVDQHADQRGASILCFDEIQVRWLLLKDLIVLHYKYLGAHLLYYKFSPRISYSDNLFFNHQNDLGMHSKEVQ